jgi:hypothetical protein
MFKIASLFLLLLDYIDIARDHIFNYTVGIKEYRDKGLEILQSYEKTLSTYKPWTLIIGSLIAFLLTKLIIRKLRKTWKKISKHFQIIL